MGEALLSIWPSLSYGRGPEGYQDSQQRDEETQVGDVGPPVPGGSPYGRMVDARKFPWPTAMGTTSRMAPRRPKLSRALASVPRAASGGAGAAGRAFGAMVKTGGLVKVVQARSGPRAMGSRPLAAPGSETALLARSFSSRRRWSST